MRNLLLITVGFIAISGGVAFAQSANNGAGSSGPEEAVRANTALNTNPQGNAPGGYNGTIASNGTGTTATGGIDRGIGSTLSTTGMGGQLGNQSSNDR